MIDDIDVRELRDEVVRRLPNSTMLFKYFCIDRWVERLPTETQHLIEDAGKSIGVWRDRPCLYLVFPMGAEVRLLDEDKLDELGYAVDTAYRITGIEQLIVMRGWRSTLVSRSADGWTMESIKVLP